MDRVGKVCVCVCVCTPVFISYVGVSVRLYKSLEEHDVLHGIFTNLEGAKPLTHKALQAEERGDYVEACQLYKEVGTVTTVAKPDVYHVLC